MGKQGGRSSKRGTYEAETPSGCVSAFFHLFDFHPFHFSLQQHQHQPSSISKDTTTTHIPKGTETPRNSLESEDNGNKIMVGSISKEENLKIPKKNKLFIKTTSTGIVSSSNVNDLSPGTKTPTLVARLMGLDLLPDTAQSPCSSSPSPSSNSSATTSSSCLSATKSHVHHHHLRPRQHHNNNFVITKARHSMDDRIAASHFFPETPRRRSDVERRRLSLQINKENMGGEEDLLMELPRFSFSELKFEEHHQNGNINNKSPRHYAKQIVKQMKESVLSSRTVGTDVTNTLKNNREKKQEQQEGGGEFVVGQFMRNKKNSPRTPSTCSSSDELSSPGKVSNNSSCSSRLRFMDPKNNNKLSKVTTKKTPKDQISPPQPRKLDNDYSRVLEEQEAHQIQKQKSSLSVPKSKKAANEKFSPRLKNNKPVIRNKQDKSLVRPLLSSSSDIKSTSKSKRNSSNHPLLINLLTLNNTVQNIHSNITPLPAAVNNKIPQKQVCAREAKYCSSQLSSGSSQTYSTKEATSSSCILSTTTTTGESNVDELDNKRKTMFNGPEFEYVSSILSRTGLSVKKAAATTTTVSVSSFHHQWLSSPPTQQQQPLVDPSIFHHLEQQQFQNQKQVFPSSVSSKYDVGLRCNRRLLFDLVNETLMSEEVVVGPYYDVEKVMWERIGRRFQSNKKCEVLEDIDALIEMQDIMGKKERKMKRPEAMVAEIEGNIRDTLLHETIRTVSVVSGGGGTERTWSTTATTPFSREEEEKTRGGTCHVGGSRDGSSWGPPGTLILTRLSDTARILIGHLLKDKIWQRNPILCFVHRLATSILWYCLLVITIFSYNLIYHISLLYSIYRSYLMKV